MLQKHACMKEIYREVYLMVRWFQTYRYIALRCEKSTLFQENYHVCSFYVFK